MFIKFTKDYKNFAKNQIADFEDNKSKRLVIKGFAEFAPKSFLLDDLYVGQVCYKDKFDNDILGRKIFKLSFANYQTKLTHVVSDAEFVLGGEQQTFVFEGYSLEKIKPFMKVFLNELIDENYTHSDYISVDKLAEFEKQLKHKQKDEEIRFEF
ncbi:MAG: hypothetical protein IJA69_04725 [Clostridia bacterium]|nr:hypothetical protein [Clostridia bacterium]